MKEENKIYNTDCRNLLKEWDGEKFDLILTSPPYNTNMKAKGGATLERGENYVKYGIVRYDSYVDVMSNEEYMNFTETIFKGFDNNLKKNGCVLYNISYGNENPSCLFTTINHIITHTDFCIADCIIWKKKSALPNSVSCNKLTRITEFVFVFCRKDEYMTFNCNKKQTSERKTGQKAYENIFNLIEAANNDGPCDLNKATYSTELCRKLLEIYAPKNALVFDPFMGTGTTAVACKENGYRFVGTELSEKQCKYALNRIDKTNRQFTLEF